MPPFGKLLRRHREAASLSREALAARSGVSEDAIGLLERGERRGPRPETVRLLALALRLNASDRAEFEASADRGRADSRARRRPIREPSDALGGAGITSTAPRGVVLSHTSAIDKHTEPETIVTAIKALPERASEPGLIPTARAASLTVAAITVGLVMSAASDTLPQVVIGGRLPAAAVVALRAFVQLAGAVAVGLMLGRYLGWSKDGSRRPSIALGVSGSAVFVAVSLLVVRPAIDAGLGMVVPPAAIGAGSQGPTVLVRGDRATTAVPTQPKTGGCSEHADAGFELGVCMSNRNTSAIVYPDVYVNQRPLGAYDCSLTIELWDGSGHRLLADGGHPCAVGHHESRQVARVVDGCFPPIHASAWIMYQGNFLRMGDSPAFVYCDARMQ